MENIVSLLSDLKISFGRLATFTIQKQKKAYSSTVSRVMELLYTLLV